VRGLLRVTALADVAELKLGLVQPQMAQKPVLAGLSARLARACISRIFREIYHFFKKKEISRNLGLFSESEKIFAKFSRNSREILKKIIEIQTEMTKNLGLIWRNLREIFWLNKALLKRNIRFPQVLEG
jgi:hypothetical protein